jgi:hypothetical protein
MAPLHAVGWCGRLQGALACSGRSGAVARYCAAALIAAPCLLHAPAAGGAEPNAPVIGFGGGYHEHPSGWEGAWIAQNFGRCCGKEDCLPVPDGGVARDLDGSYTVLESGETFAWNDPQIEQSQDGTYWRCKYNAGQLRGQTRCLFVPPLGF